MPDNKSVPSRRKTLTRSQARFLANALMDFCQGTGKQSDFRTASRIADRMGEVQVADWLDERRCFFSKIRRIEFRTIVARRERSDFTAIG